MELIELMELVELIGLVELMELVELASNFESSMVTKSFRDLLYKSNERIK